MRPQSAPHADCFKLPSTSGPTRSTNESGIHYIPRLPEGWELHRAARLFREVAEPNIEDMPILSVSIHDGISDRQLEDEDRDRKSNFIEDKSSYKRVRPGYLAYNMMRAWQGAVGISTVEGAVSPAYVVARPIQELHSKYFRYLFRSPEVVEQMRQGSKGIADFRLRLYWEQFRQILLPVPPIEEQAAIAAFLDHEMGLVDQLIEKRERVPNLIRSTWKAMIQEAISLNDTRQIRFGLAAQRTHRHVDRDDEATYIPIGMYNRGRGLFKKPMTNGAELGESEFFWIAEDDLIFSGQFAWEGALGLASGEEHGCVASHRYPVFRAAEGIEPGYLFAFFNTDRGQFLMENHSRGAAGRNRPLNAESLSRGCYGLSCMIDSVCGDDSQAVSV